MKNITKRELSKLAALEPDSCIAIRTLAGVKNGTIGFRVNNRLLTVNGRISFRGYKNRIISWDDFNSNPTFWRNIDSTEADAELNEEIVKDALDIFVEVSKNHKIYAITETEFSEVVPQMSEGTYVFFIERTEE